MNATQRYMIEDVINKTVFHTNDYTLARERVNFVYRTTRSGHIRLTDHKAGTWIDYKLDNYHTKIKTNTKEG